MMSGKLKGINEGEVLYEVLSPVGEVTLKTLSIAPRLDTLADKTICELSLGMYNVQESFPTIREELKKRYNNVKVIPYSEFPEIIMMVPGKEYQQYVENQVALVRQKGCDAVILGNGG